MRPFALLAAAVILFALATVARAGEILDRVRTRGQLGCVVLSEPADYTTDDTHGALSALGADVCRAVAAAVLGDPGRVRIGFAPDEAHGFAAIQSGRADLLLGATPRLAAGPQYGVAFGRPVFFDGQGFMADRSRHIAALGDLAGKQVCYIATSPADAGLTAAMAASSIAIRRFPFEEMGEMEAALVTGHCAAMTADLSQLADARAEFHARAADFAILADRITLDPVAPAWRDDDAQWGRVVDYTVSALLDAEQAGIGQGDIAALRPDRPGRAAALLAADRAGAQALGLQTGWSLRALAAVGNYAELFRRDLGDGSPLRLPRGPNALWRAGGLMYPLPTQ